MHDSSLEERVSCELVSVKIPCERVLKPPGDRDRPAQRNVEPRQLLRGKSRSGVDQGPGLGDDHLGQFELGVQSNEFRTEPIRFARSSAVPDREQFNPMLLTSRAS